MSCHRSCGKPFVPFRLLSCAVVLRIGVRIDEFAARVVFLFLFITASMVGGKLLIVGITTCYVAAVKGYLARAFLVLIVKAVVKEARIFAMPGTRSQTYTQLFRSGTHSKGYSFLQQ